MLVWIAQVRGKAYLGIVGELGVRVVEGKLQSKGL